MINPLLMAGALAVAARLLGVLSFRAPRQWLRLAMRIIAAWLFAIAMLAAIIPLVITTPGYQKDHME